MENQDFKHWGLVIRLIVGLIVFILIWFIGINPIYQIWAKARHGEAQLREAGYNRQIKVTEAQALLESERLNKESEIVRAEGVARANQIVAGSINEQYIRYLWVKTLDHEGNKTVIYVPTEAQLPITEAPRLNQP